MPMLTSEPARRRNPRGATLSLYARISSIRGTSRSGVTWSPKPWLAEWSVIAK